MIVRRNRQNALRFITDGMKALKVKQREAVKYAKLFNSTFSPPLAEAEVERVVSQQWKVRRPRGGRVSSEVTTVNHVVM